MARSTDPYGDFHRALADLIAAVKNAARPPFERLARTITRWIS